MKAATRISSAVASVSLLVAGSANGQNLTANFVGVVPGLNVFGTVDNGSFSQSYPSGVLSFTDFQAFCIEPSQGLADGDMPVYQIQNPLTLTVADNVARLVGAYLALWGGGAPVTEQDKVDRSPDAAAIHWAIWEVTTEQLAPYSLSDGNVRITGSASNDTNTIARANQFLANMPSYTPASLTFLSNGTYQDVATWNVVPEPGSAGLLALAGMMVLRRRRR